MGSGLRKWTGVTSGHPFFCAALSMVSFGLGSGRECWEPIVGCVAGASGGLGHIPKVPPDWFKIFAGVAHSQAMWPQSWHLKHWRELVSFLFEVLPWLSLDPWAFPWLWHVVPVLQPADMLQAEVVCPRPVQSLWEMEQPGVFLSIHPLPQPLCLGLFGALLELLPCPALVRAAISLAIWFPNSVVPLTGLMVTADLALTLSWASLFLLSTFWAAIMSCK